MPSLNGRRKQRSLKGKVKEIKKVIVRLTVTVKVKVKVTVIVSMKVTVTKSPPVEVVSMRSW